MATYFWLRPILVHWNALATATQNQTLLLLLLLLSFVRGSWFTGCQPGGLTAFGAELARAAAAAAAALR